MPSSTCGKREKSERDDFVSIGKLENHAFFVAAIGAFASVLDVEGSSLGGSFVDREAFLGFCCSWVAIESDDFPGLEK